MLTNKFIEIITEPLQKFIFDPPFCNKMKNLNYLKRYTTDLLKLLNKQKKKQLFTSLNQAFSISISILLVFSIFWTDE